MKDALAVIDQQPVVVTPMTMIEMAVKSGANVDQLQKLFELKLAVEKDEARKAYVAAMSAFKRNPPAVHKTKAVSFGAGKTSYKHATLDDASEQIGRALAEHGLSHRWDVEQIDGGLIRVTCILTHDLGHSERVTLQATADTSGSKNSIQAVGSTVSYLQRYSLFAATGVAPKDADNDGAGEVKTMSETQKADFLASIDGIADKDGWQTLWEKITRACTDCGDIPAYEELKGKMARKFKALAA